MSQSLPRAIRRIVSTSLWISAFAGSLLVATAHSAESVADKMAAPAITTTPTVEGTGSRPISFTNEIVPILTKAGCNAGVCHAKAGGGQNGFQLSLYGYEPQEDYDHIVREGRGRRIFLASPEMSLLLQKATAMDPHGGGVRIEEGSIEYNLLLHWISQGASYQPEGEPTLTKIRLEPTSGVLQPETGQQLKLVAHYSDKSTRDVSRFALFESNDSAMLDVTESGYVTASDIPGRASVMVRFQDRSAVYSVAIPVSPTKSATDTEQVTPVVGHEPKPKNFIDQFVFDNLKTLRIPPSSLCEDATFLRRVTLDIAGRLPTTEEAQTFVANAEEDRRDRAIEFLLDSQGYADFFANKWTTLLKNRRDDKGDITANFAFHAWVRDGLLANRPYDQMVGDLLAATGAVADNPPVAWYKRVKDPKEQMEDVAQLFLGVRMKCAQCHHHPFEKWSQDDYYSLAAFFAQVGRKPTSVRLEDMIFHKRGKAEIKNPRSGKPQSPRPLGGEAGEISPNHDPRLDLANWMRAKDNPFFAKALVNRYWKHFFSRGIVEPEDDLRDTNPPTNPELLAALEKHFVESGFDLKDLVRVITQSAAYQLSAIPNEVNIADRQNYSRFYPRRLQAEVLLDAIDDLTGASTSFANLPMGTRAIALPDNSYNVAIPFLKTFGRPERASVCECERDPMASLGQSLHFLNASGIQAKLGTANGLVENLIKEVESPEERVTQIYLMAFSREPTENEMKSALAYLAEAAVAADGKPGDVTTAARDNLQDLLWAVINTKEFQFNH